MQQFKVLVKQETIDGCIALCRVCGCEPTFKKLGALVRWAERQRSRPDSHEWA